MMPRAALWMLTLSLAGTSGCGVGATGTSIVEEETQPGSRDDRLDRAIVLALDELGAEIPIANQNYELRAYREETTWNLTFEFGDGSAIVAQVGDDQALIIHRIAARDPESRPSAIPLDRAVRIALEKIREESLMPLESFRLTADRDGSTWELLFEFVPLTPDKYVVVYVSSDGSADLG